MKTYLQRLIIVFSISGMHAGLYAEYADTQYHIPHLDPARIAAKKQFFDRKYRRSKYMRYGGMALVAAWIAYSGYKYWFKQPSRDIALTAEGDVPMVRRVALLQHEVDHLKKNMELVKGNNWLAWGSDLMHHALWGIELTTIFKIGIALGAAPAIARFLSPLLDIDELRYELRSDIDFMKSIIAKVRFLAHEDRKTIDRAHVCRMTQDTVLLVKKQIENLIGFVQHKQMQYQDKYPHIVNQVNDQVNYIILSFNSLADRLSHLLNDDDLPFEMLSHLIIEHTQQFGQEYNGVKDQLKALEDRLYEEASERA